MSINPELPALASPPPADASQSLQELLRVYGTVLKRGWHLILISVVVCLTLATFYLILVPKNYEANTRLLVLQQGGRPINVASNDTSQLAERNDDYIPTHMQIVSSPRVVAKAIEIAGPKNLPTLAKSDSYVNGPVGHAIERLVVDRPDRTANFLTVSYRAYFPEEAVLFLNALMKSYLAFIKESYQSKSNEAIGLITKAPTS